MISFIKNPKHIYIGMHWKAKQHTLDIHPIPIFGIRIALWGPSCYVLRKNGAFLRRRSQVPAEKLEDAGRFTIEEARAIERGGEIPITRHHLKEFTPSEPHSLTNNPGQAAAILLSLFILPGTGTLLQKRWAEGAGQLMIALAGAGIAIFQTTRIIATSIQSFQDPTLTHELPNQLLSMGLGILLLAAAWIWSSTTKRCRNQK